VLQLITEDPEFTFNEEGVEQIEDAIESMFHQELAFPDLLNDPSLIEHLGEELFDQVVELRAARAERFGAEQLCDVEQELLLRTIDEMWIDHLTAIEHLEDRVDLMSYAQLDPLVLFKTEVAAMYKRLIQSIRRHAVTLWFGMELAKEKRRGPKGRTGPGKRTKRKG